MEGGPYTREVEFLLDASGAHARYRLSQALQAKILLAFLMDPQPVTCLFNTHRYSTILFIRMPLRCDSDGKMPLQSRYTHYSY